VIPNTVGLGSWCSCLPPLPAYNFTPVSSLHFEGTVPYDIPIYDLLGVQVNPSTAYLMLHDSGRSPLTPGDVVILTAGRSAVSTAAAQIAKHKFGAKVVAVVRRKDRTDEEWEEVEKEMRENGVDLLLEEVREWERERGEERGENIRPYLKKTKAHPLALSLCNPLSFRLAGNGKKDSTEEIN
jgi:hypothetical protein